MSYLSLMAHLNQAVIGLDLRSEVGWQREHVLGEIAHALDQKSAHLRTVFPDGNERTLK